MTIHKESLDPNRDLTIYHQMNSWKNKTIPGGSYVLRDLLDPIFLNGELVYEVPDLQESVRTVNRNFPVCGMRFCALNIRRPTMSISASSCWI